MSLIALTSARCSPGTTTTALGLALAWPTPVLLVEADMATSSPILAGYFAGTRPHEKGLLDLAVAARKGRLWESLSKASIPLPTNPAAAFIAGINHTAQAASMSALWQPLADLAADLEAQTGTDVIVDAGRLGTVHGPQAMLLAADVLLMSTRATLAAALATRSRSLTLTDDIKEYGRVGESAALLRIGPPSPYSDRELTDLTGLPVAAALPWDVQAATLFSDGAYQLTRGLGDAANAMETQTSKVMAKSKLGRSFRPAAEKIKRLAVENRSKIEVTL